MLEAVAAFAGDMDRDPILGAETAVPTDLEVSPKSRNVIPERVRVVIDWRVLPGLDADAAVRRVEEALASSPAPPEGYAIDVRFARERQRTYTDREDDRRLFTPGFLLEPRHPVARAAAAAIERATGRVPALRPWTFATDGGHTCGEHGIPTIGYAPGEERFAHTARERLELASARVAYRAYADLVPAVQRAAS